MSNHDTNMTGQDGVLAALSASHAAAAERLVAGVKALRDLLPVGGVLFSDQLRAPGQPPVDVVFVWPGMLMALDPVSGEIMREAPAVSMHSDVPHVVRFMARKTKGRPLLTADFSPGHGRRLRATMGADGVVRVHTVRGGELVAMSEPGEPGALFPGSYFLSVEDLQPRVD